MTRGNSCVLEDVAFSTSTAVTDMMTVGTSVMRGGVFSVLLNFANWNCQWLKFVLLKVLMHLGNTNS